LYKHPRHLLDIQPPINSVNPDLDEIVCTPSGEAGKPFCDTCSPYPDTDNCVIQHIAAEVPTNPDVRRRLTEFLTDSTDIDGFADYLLKLSEIDLGEENAKLSFCILARTPHDKVEKIAMILHRTLKIRIKEENDNKRDTGT